MALFVRSFLLLCMFMLPSICNGAFHKTHVKVINSLHGNLDLTIHIKSKDDDLGVHVLHPGDFYEWGFRTSFIASTLFFGTFQWENVTKRFDIYKRERDEPTCSV